MEDRRSQDLSRREFVGRALAGTVVAGGLPAAVLAEAGKEKRTPVDRVKLGATPVRPTRLGVGTGSQGGKVQRDLGKEGFHRLIRHAYDRGIRFFDTADMYRTHELLGEAIKGLPREELVIQTKVRWEPFVPDALKELERFRKEAGVDYFDIVLIHCAQKKNWPADLQKLRDGLSAAKEKGLLRAHGVSCHGLPALKEVAGCPWVEVNLARVNHRGHHMDGAEGQWAEPGNFEDSVAELKKIHAAGKGIIGMKIVGNGDFTGAEDREKSVRFAMSSPFVDAVIMGFKSPEEIDEALKRMEGALKV